jgi:hypothetical protein
MLGIRDIWIPPVKFPEIKVMPGEPVPVTYEEPRYDSVPALARIMPDSLLKLAPVTDRESLEGEKQTVKEPPISLQVAVYHSRARAMRARKKIMKTLTCPLKLQCNGNLQGNHTRFPYTGGNYRYYPNLQVLDLIQSI